MKRAVFLLTGLIVLGFFGYGHAEVEWTVQRILQMEKTPIDFAVSLNGRWVFVLTDQGEILIYASDGTLKDTISVGKFVDGIKAGPRDDILLLSSRRDKSVRIITLDFIQEINVSGSPFKGPAEAPVVLAVFSDFQ
ncbi:MAG: hypothetical protein JSW12_08045 [Deltaproteobacteria bacterium]|nr:MAG: hypothetical protein JSW12_08045 [Deltaproteobacteria bacterium]